MDPYALSLLRAEPLRKPLLRQIIAALDLPTGSRGLDAGCGLGLQTLILAGAVGPSGSVTGLDASEAFLEHAREFARQAGLVSQVSFHPGSWDELPFADDAFDWVWSADAAGYAAPDPLRVVRELGRVVKPGGRVILCFWSSQVLLPGYPALEARLNATRAGIAPFSPDARPETHFLNTAGWLQAAGFTNLHAETFARTVIPPLAEDLRAALADLFQMRWGSAQADLTPEDWQQFQRLCRPESPDFILNSPSYCGFFTCTVFSGSVPPG